jgi:predicted ATPase
LVEASEHVDAGLTLYDEERHAHHRYVYLGHDPAVCALGIGASVQWSLGYPARAMRSEAKAVTLARRLLHAPSLAQALRAVCQSQVARGDRAAVIATATELLGLSEEHGPAPLRAFALVFLGWALGRSGETAEGIVRLEEGLATLSKTGTQADMTRCFCLMAETHLATGGCGEGLDEVARALDFAAETGEEYYLPRLHQVKAELLLHAHGPGDEAVEASLRQALAVARQQSAKGWELPAATSLARLWFDRGRRDVARELLTPIYGWFTEGFDTPDLKEAKALLDELA